MKLNKQRAVGLMLLSCVGLFFGDLKSDTGQSLTDGIYSIQHQANGRYVDAYELTHDTSLVTRPQQNDDTQLWIVRSLGDGTYSLQQKINERYMDAYENNKSPKKEFEVVTRTAQDNDSQKWILTPVVDNIFRIQQKSTLRFVDAYYKKNILKDFRLVTRTKQNNRTQEWKFTRRGNIPVEPDYIVMETAEIREIVEKFAPVLKFHWEASTFPMDAQIWWDEMLCGNDGGPKLLDPEDQGSGYDYEPCKTHDIGWGNDSLANLINGDKSISTLAEHGYKVPTYYQVRSCGSAGQLRIHYGWFYGYQQPANFFGGSQAHAADWEHILVTTSEDRISIAAVTYYQHSGWYTKIVGKGDPNFPIENGHPIVFVGQTAHGSYHNDEGKHGTWAYFDDLRSPGNTEPWYTANSPLLNLDSNIQSWMEADRNAEWMWGFTGVRGHPTVKYSDLGFCSLGACESTEGVLKKSGCRFGYSDCRSGHTNCGDIWCAADSTKCLPGGDNSYKKDWMLPKSDRGILEH